MPGDWYDTLLIPDDGSAVVRFQTDDFVGSTVMHCHYLPHEDRGCMGTILVQGQEGTPPKVLSQRKRWQELSKEEYEKVYERAAQLPGRYRDSYDKAAECEHALFMMQHMPGMGMDMSKGDCGGMMGTEDASASKVE